MMAHRLIQVTKEASADRPKTSQAAMAHAQLDTATCQPQPPSLKASVSAGRPAKNTANHHVALV